MPQLLIVFALAAACSTSRGARCAPEDIVGEAHQTSLGPVPLAELLPIIAAVSLECMPTGLQPLPPPLERAPYAFVAGLSESGRHFELLVAPDFSTQALRRICAPDDAPHHFVFVALQSSTADTAVIEVRYPDGRCMADLLLTLRHQDRWRAVDLAPANPGRVC